MASIFGWENPSAYIPNNFPHNPYSKPFDLPYYHPAPCPNVVTKRWVQCMSVSITVQMCCISQRLICTWRNTDLAGEEVRKW